MFIYSVRASTLKFFAAMLTGVVALVMLIILIPTVETPDAEPVAAETADGRRIKYDGVRSNDDRVAFLAQFGWTVEPEPCEQQEVTIPDEFDAVFTGYNEIQKRQGLDLSRYAKCDMTRYTYVVTNYPDYGGTVYANMLIYKNTVVAGDISSADVNGFVHGFDAPSGAE